jgi:hypothetical protein
LDRLGYFEAEITPDLSSCNAKSFLSLGGDAEDGHGLEMMNPVAACGGPGEPVVGRSITTTPTDPTDLKRNSRS